MLVIGGLVMLMIVVMLSRVYDIMCNGHSDGCVVGIDDGVMMDGVAVVDVNMRICYAV